MLGIYWQLNILALYYNMDYLANLCPSLLHWHHSFAPSLSMTS